MLQVMPAYTKLLGQPQPSGLQRPSFAPIQQPSQDDNNALPNIQGSYPPLQYTDQLQQQRYYNQQQPNQVGVTYHNLQSLANPDGPAQVAFYNNITRFNNLTQAQRTHELGLDRVYTPQDFQHLPSTNAPKTNGQTQYWDGTAPNPSVIQRVGNVAKAPVKGAQVILHSLHKLMGLL